jgi:DNA-binding transcriptional LysR family regulator
VRHVICASPNYLASNGIPKTLDDIAKHRVVSFQSVSALSTWIFEQEGAETAVSFCSRLSVNTIDAAIDAALSGAGLVRAVSYQIADYVRAGRLAVVLEEFEPQLRPVHLVYDSQNRLPLKLRAFVDFVVPRMRERLTNAKL